MKSIAIIGGGFSGLCCLAALVRHAAVPLHVTIYHPDNALGRGKAYSTQDPEHLLNVRAGAMGAHAGAEDGFHQWITAQGLDYKAADFVPRMVYGRYLDHELAQTLVAAQAKGLRIFRVHENALHVRAQDHKLVVDTATGPHGVSHLHDAVILACGNDRPRMPVLGAGVARHAGWWPHPYQADRYADIQKAGHVIIIGSGLSMIDALVTLRRTGYDGDITALSRHGQIPMAHVESSTAFAWTDDDLRGLTSPARVLRHVRAQAAITGADWRDVLDGIRGHANDIWRGFSPTDRARAARYMSFWNTRRHRIPQQMHDMASTMIAQGQLRLLAGRVEKLEAIGSSLYVYGSAGVQEGQIVINCLGYDYSIRPQDGSLLSRLAAAQMMTLAEGFPQPVGTAGGLHKQHALYGVGPLWQGHLIESTAVRDIRGQADQVARAILQRE